MDCNVEWRPVPSWFSTEHEVSSDGRIRRTIDAARVKGRRGGAQWKAGYELALSPDSRGYVRVSHGSKKIGVHRLICEAFNGPPPFPGCMVLHGNDVKSDNRASNLRWGTMIENHADAVRNGRYVRCAQRFDRGEASRLRLTGLTFRRIGAILGVSHVAIMNGLKEAA
ncbi:HNH endonuclease signature motif containing protein [Cereibacter azotoformans]|uniref:HNH endonuclease n=1 Tax=Cereibacter azotoformans TaxID=43057 RepID=A0A2T5K768_9RHOB|nr:HNH endonuclease signature motif containing protein [Cereibacter azotoformans]MBO4169521.1 HNH endonuclease [Cereibacter azotoformans]PTR18198.1 HNH endonuclease [Cereibacter azotoformans]